MTRIHDRPPEIEERLIPGHWEGDRIKGARHASAIGTPVERTALCVTRARMEHACAEAAAAGFGTVLPRLEAQPRLSITYDQGREVAPHERETIHRTEEGYPMTKAETFSSVWDAIADTPEQAANLQARAELMRQIAAIIKDNDWKQAAAAAHCGVTQPRINDLLRGRVSRFSLDALVNIATALGRRVHVELEVA